MHATTEHFVGKEDIPGLQIDFSKEIAWNRWESIFERSWLRGMLKDNQLQSFDTLFLLVASFSDLSTGHESIAPMTRFDKCSCEMISDLPGDVEERIWRENRLNRLDEKINHFKSRLVEPFRKLRGSSVYILKHHFLDYVVDHIRSFAKLLISGISLFAHFNVYIKRAYRIPSQCSQSYHERSGSEEKRT